MKRQAALIPLSREHHDALSYARQAVAASQGQHADTVRLRTLALWDSSIAAHLATEEASLLPALAAAGAGDEAARAFAQHQQLRQLMARLRDGEPDALAEWGEAMREHVRYEERVLFPLAQRLLDLDALANTLNRPSTLPTVSI